MPLAGRPMVAHVLRRAAVISEVDEVVAAIPDLPEDDELELAVSHEGVRVIRGSGDDVLGRYAAAAAQTNARIVIRMTADCPLLSPQVSHRVLSSFVHCDYASNTLQRTYPRGLDTEVFSREALDVAAREARDPVDREHVTPFIYRNASRFLLRQVTNDIDRSDLRWTVDTADDLAFARAVYDALGPQFEFDDVLALLNDRPELTALNRGSAQKELGQ